MVLLRRLEFVDVSDQLTFAATELGTYVAETSVHPLLRVSEAGGSGALHCVC